MRSVALASTTASAGNLPAPHITPPHDAPETGLALAAISCAASTPDDNPSSIEFCNDLDDATAGRLVELAGSYESRRIQAGFAKRSLRDRLRIFEAKAELSFLGWLQRHFDADVFPFALLSALVLGGFGLVAIINWQTHALLSILGGGQ